MPDRKQTIRQQTVAAALNISLAEGLEPPFVAAVLNAHGGVAAGRFWLGDADEWVTETLVKSEDPAPSDTPMHMLVVDKNSSGLHFVIEHGKPPRKLEII